MILAGDINSYSQPVIDHNGGPSCIRPESLSSTLLALGFRDTFRHRFPTTTAFTHISKSGGSRLDHAWVRPAPGLHFETFSSCIIWDQPFQTDHCPLVAHFLSTIQIINEKIDRPLQPPWRRLLSEAADNKFNAKIRQDVLGKIGPNKDLMETARGESLKVREAAHNRDKMDPIKPRPLLKTRTWQETSLCWKRSLGRRLNPIIRKIHVAGVCPCDCYPSSKNAPTDSNTQARS